MLVAEQIAVARGLRTIAEGLDFSVPAGTFLVVAGQNGAGKTTLLRTLSGELAPRSGRIVLDGVNIKTMSRQQLARKRVFLAQRTECHLPFLARELVLLGAEAAGHGGRSARSCSERALLAAGVANLSERVVSKLSGGEQQRIHWARVLAQLDGQSAGRIVFLDEPTSSLDLAHQHELLAQARALAQRGATVVAVLHDLNLAARYADAILLLHNGRLHAHGPPATVLNPETIREVFRVRAAVVSPPGVGSPLVVVAEVVGQS